MGRGESGRVVRGYLSGNGDKRPDVLIRPELHQNSAVILKRCWIADANGDSVAAVPVDEAFKIGLQVQATQQVKDTDITVHIHNSLGHTLLVS